jgi:hypothetical protein
MFTCELHNRIKPLPEGEVAFWQWFFTELRPTKHHGAVISNLLLATTPISQHPDLEKLLLDLHR